MGARNNGGTGRPAIASAVVNFLVRRARVRRAVACDSVLVTASGSLSAQPSDAIENRGTLKIDVTGSNVRRSEVESALPVQVIAHEDILRSGATTTAELMSRVSANILGFNDQLSVGDNVRPGLSSVNLRGIGDGSTLVLVNGRRVANYAFDGATVDVNSIPAVSASAWGLRCIRS